MSTKVEDMDFSELACKRFSCRNYKADPVPADILEKVLQAGRVAPSAVNFQPWHFYVIQKGALQSIYECYHRDWFRSAPCVIVLCGDHDRSWKRREGKDHVDIDVAIATDHMTLQATELGLASCWVCNFDPEAVRRALNLPENQEPVVILPLGYPVDEGDALRHDVKRRPLSDLASFIE